MPDLAMLTLTYPAIDPVLVIGPYNRWYAVLHRGYPAGLALHDLACRSHHETLGTCDDFVVWAFGIVLEDACSNF